MKSYEDVQKELVGVASPALLVANGFSQAWNSDIFNYANLYEKADFQESSTILRGLFEHFQTYDFERVMNHLLSAEAVAKAYGADEAVVKKIENDQQVLKDALIATIGKTHPGRPMDVSEKAYVSAREFLSRFDRIFSLNYDLLLYWARNQSELAPGGHLADDGFRTEARWVPEEADQKVFFLHGGLHLYDTGFDIRKLAYKSSGTSIIDQVRGNLEKGVFPLFVSEPTAERKKARIEHNPYLSYGFRELTKLDSALVVYGHSVHDNDKHIFDQIKLSAVSKVFVSLFGDESSDANVRTKANAQAYLEKKGRAIEFFDAGSVKVW